jgi:hypothetical protein
MKKLIFAMILTVVSGVVAFGQATGDYKKTEFFVGYSNGQIDTGFDSGSSVDDFLDDRANFHGFNASGVYNVSRYFGVKADVSGTYNKTRFSVPVVTGTTTQTVSFDTDNSLYNFLGGVQVKDNASTARFKPFAHALVGAAHGRSKVKNVVCSTTATINCNDILVGGSSDTGLAGAIGGGLDIKITDKIDFRAIQVDYNPVRANGTIDHNLRIGVGLVF